MTKRASMDTSPEGTRQEGHARVARQAFLMHSLNLGVLISGGNRNYLSAAHSSEVVDHMIDVFQESLALVREDGLF
jgi:glutamate-1-semialdehyde 2,1-aminomutase